MSEKKVINLLNKKPRPPSYREFQEQTTRIQDKVSSLKGMVEDATANLAVEQARVVNDNFSSVKDSLSSLKSLILNFTPRLVKLEAEIEELRKEAESSRELRVKEEKLLDYLLKQFKV